jgi:hypothetical protein
MSHQNQIPVELVYNLMKGTEYFVVIKECCSNRGVCFMMNSEELICTTACLTQ